VQTALQLNPLSESVTITHPFHPLYAQTFALVKVKYVNGIPLWSLQTKSTHSPYLTPWTQMLWRWAKRRHPNKRATWIKAKYFVQRGNRGWVFSDGKQDLLHMSDFPIIRHIKVQGNRSPYRAKDKDYFDKRRKRLLISGSTDSIGESSRKRMVSADCADA
jgi:hypothetical protein